MKPLKNKVSITLDEDLIERIKQLAEDDDRSFSQYINMVLKEHLNSIEKNPMTRIQKDTITYICISNGVLSIFQVLLP